MTNLHAASNPAGTAFEHAARGPFRSPPHPPPNRPTDLADFARALYLKDQQPIQEQ
jgi:hypothetical protein